MCRRGGAARAGHRDAIGANRAAGLGFRALNTYPARRFPPDAGHRPDRASFSVLTKLAKYMAKSSDNSAAAALKFETAGNFDAKPLVEQGFVKVEDFPDPLCLSIMAFHSMGELVCFRFVNWYLYYLDITDEF